MKKTLIIVLGIVCLLALAFFQISRPTEAAKLDIGPPVVEASLKLPAAHPDLSPNAPPPPQALAEVTDNGCRSCHQGIESIRDPESGMMQKILEKAATAGFEDNDCIVCHGGNPTATSAKVAHDGTIAYFTENEGPKNFYPDPGSPWINEHTCGMCHAEQVSTQFTSLMFTEAGKIQGTTWGFGGLQGYEHNVANLPVKELELHERMGTDTYKKYMAELKEAEPGVFPGEMKGLPPAPTREEVQKNPELAVYTYLRQECQRCHTGVKGRFREGDFRGIGCSSCHIPYSNKGYYEGADPTIDPDEQGHLLVHAIQGTREAKVEVNGQSYSGIPVKTCQACHNRGRRIGVSYEGLMETAYQSPFMSGGEGQSKLHSKNYLHLQPDVHMTKGMLCQDCHTSNDAHSYGDLSGAIAGAVEIECQDCHGTPEFDPWELPIGYGDEITTLPPATGAARGLANELLPHLKKGTVHPKQEGYLISSRGNPMPNLVKSGEQIILHSASGKDIPFKSLKWLTEHDSLTQEGKVAMVNTPKHIDKMECYACHAVWAPQCYGCHISIDYSKEDLKKDWVAVAGTADEHGQTINERNYGKMGSSEAESIANFLAAGEVTEQRSYLRWEDPPLAINGDHRVAPAIPGCQTTVTVIGPDGKPVLLNHIFKVAHAEGAGVEGQLAIDMAPLQPHTVQAGSRTCESCHTNPKSMGLGIEAGELYNRPDTNFVIDLADAEGNPLASKRDTLFNAIPNLKMDWSRFVDENGKQLQTVGHHFSGSRPLNKEEMVMLDRKGVCLSCHQYVPEEDLAINLLHHVAAVTEYEIDNDTHQGLVSKSIRVTAWVQILLGILVGVGLTFGAIWLWRKRKNRNRKTSTS